MNSLLRSFHKLKLGSTKRLIYEKPLPICTKSIDFSIQTQSIHNKAILSGSLTGCNVPYQQVRFKKQSSKGKNSKKKVIDEDLDEEEDDEDENDDKFQKDIDNIDTFNFVPGYKIVVKSVPSLRFDSVISTGLNLSRNKIEDCFYSSKLKLNGEKMTKKSATVKESDTLELIGEMDDKVGKRILKRVQIEKVYDPKRGGKRSKVLLVVWKAGLYEEDQPKR